MKIHKLPERLVEHIGRVRDAHLRRVEIVAAPATVITGGRTNYRADFFFNLTYCRCFHPRKQ